MVGSTSSRLLRIALWAGGLTVVVLILAGIALTSAFLWFGRSEAQSDGTVLAEGITARIEVVRDRNGIPHIFASTGDDALFAEGYVHAQDRLFQMDMMRLLARGRLAEFVGRPALASDRFMRGLDLVANAERGLAAMDDASRSALDAYVRGVNALLENPTLVLPPEYAVTGRIPEPWTAVDSLLWGELMAVQLAGNWRDELTRQRLLAKHPIDVITMLWPEIPVDAATTIKEQAKAWSIPDIEAMIAALPAPLGPSQASNGWVFAGARTASGKPLLANDPHLQLGAPSVWYLARLEAPGFRRVGASAPGVPGILLGHNGRVAWGMTTTGADTFDLFLERVTPDDSDSYETPTGPAKFESRTHAIKIKDEDTPYRMTVRRTRHGVVLSDITGDGADGAPSGHVLVLSGAMFLNANTTGEGLLRLNGANNVDTALTALASWIAPVQNVFLADVDGRIAIAATGLVPKRKRGDGSAPQPGWNGDYDWEGTVAPEAMPRSIDPASGVLINANNRLVGDDAGVFLARDWDASYRALRLTEGLAEAQGQDVRSARTWQLDHTSVFARTFLEALEGWSPTEPDLRYYVTMFRDWDYALSRSRPEPLAFNGWMRALRAAVLKALIGADGADIMRGAREFPHLLLAVAKNEGEVCAKIDCRQTLASSLREAGEQLTEVHGADRLGWRWGNTHAAIFEHPLWSRVPYLREWLRFSVASDGDNFTVNRGTASSRDGLALFPHVHGPSLRAIYDLADLDRAQFMIAPGQSGHPLSAHWGDLASLWANGRYVAIAGTREEVRVDGASLMLAPR